MASKRAKERSVVTQMAEDGDGMAEAVLRDMDEEDGVGQDALPEAWEPKAGDKVFIFTGAYFHNGRLTKVDHEGYYLDRGSVTIYETGPLTDLFAKGKAKSCEVLSPPSVVRKGPTGQIVLWPFKDLITQQS